MSRSPVDKKAQALYYKFVEMLKEALPRGEDKLHDPANPYSAKIIAPEPV